MSRRASRYEREIKSEERRAVIWLGVLAAVVGFRFWVRDDNYFNFACDYPCPHVTFAWVPVLNFLIFSWLLYAACMLVYFSEDMLWKRPRARRIARRVGHGFLIVWPTTFAFVIAFSEGTFLMGNWPQWTQTLYFIGASYLFGRMIFWYVETVTGRKITGRKGVFAGLGESFEDGLKVIAELVIEGLLPIFERMLRRLLRGRIPPKVILRGRKVKRILGRRKGRVRIRYWKYPD